jgi:GNAT superfamily N-acetyltransferase
MAVEPARGPDGSRLEIRREGVDYLVRPYEDGDATGFLSLLSSSLPDSNRDEEWFRRTYVDIPYLDHVPLFVVESEGEIVGARPFTAFRVRAGEEVVTALLTRDTLVHPDHRRRGLFTEATELALRYYETARPAFVFSHSNPNSVPGYRKMGWSYLGQREEYCRLHAPENLIAARTRDLVTSLLSPVASPLSRLHLGVRDRRSSSPDDIAVTRHGSVSAETLASLSARRRPETPHVVRDEAFYRWRLGNPEWQPNTTFLARRNGESVAGVVTCKRDGAFSCTSVVDVVPRTGGDTWTNAIAALLDSVIADSRGSDVLRVPEPVFPASLLGERGFLSSDRLPLSALVIDRRRLRLGLRPLDGTEATIDGFPVRGAAPELWSVAH